MRSRLLSIPPVAQQRLGLTVADTQTLTLLVHEALEVLSGRMEAPPMEEDAEEAPQAAKPLPVGQKRRGPKPRYS